MSAHPGVASSRRRIGVAGPVLALSSLLVVAACDQPTQPEVVAPPQFALGTSDECPTLPGGNGPAKTANVTVTLSTGDKLPGVVVTLIDPVEKGPVCSAVTDNSGVAQFTNLTRGAKYLLSIRDEVSEYAPLVEIGPAAPNDFALINLRDDPSFQTPRQTPTLLSGTECSVKSTLSWDGWIGAYLTPCLVPTSGGPNFPVDVTLEATDAMLINIVDPNGEVTSDVLVAAISTPVAQPDTQKIRIACETMPWLQNCTDPALFSGPGLLQAMGVTNTGSIALGVSQGDSPMYIEVTAPQAGDNFTLFGTLVLNEPIGDALLQNFSHDEHTVYLAPGMCRITEVNDAVEPAGFSELDIDRTGHSLGLLTVANDLEPMQLLEIPSTIVVHAVIFATEIGGTGNFTMQYAGEKGGNRTIRIPFSISGDTCEAGTASGNGVGGGVEAVGYCTKTGTHDDGRDIITLYFTTTNLPALSRAGYNLDAAKDNLDPSRADGTGGRKLSRGSIDIDLTPSTCDVPTNNDGRWLIL